MQTTLESGFLRRWRRGAAENPQRARCLDQLHPALAAEIQGGVVAPGCQPVAESQDLEDVSLEIEVPCYVGAAEAELVGGVDQAAKSEGRAEDHLRCVLTPARDLTSIPEAEAHRKVGAQEVFQDGSQEVCDGSDDGAPLSANLMRIYGVSL
jgi:hypothetical protein